MALSDPKFPKALEGEGGAMVASPWDSLFSWPFPPGMVGFRSSYHCAELPFRPAKMWKMQHFPWEIAYLEFCGYHSSLLVKLGTVWTEVPVPHKVKPWKEKRGFNLLIRRALWHRFTMVFVLSFTKGKRRGSRRWRDKGVQTPRRQDRPSPSLSQCQHHRERWRKPQQQDGRVSALASMLSSAVCLVPR